MSVDKNLFLYDFAIVAVMKNEGPYIKEWLDYHLLAGVEHFYIYDNDSSDNMKEVLQPYIEREIVTYHFRSGKRQQMPVFNEAIQKYKFFCRYIAFIDGDEFIFPQENKSIIEVADEILADKPHVGGIEINWMYYGSNNLEKADYSKGVLERFTRRAKEPAIHCKSIVNPRTVDYLHTPHFMNYFFSNINLNAGNIKFFTNSRYTIPDKILVNHYFLKSREEYAKKSPRGDVAFGQKNYYPMSDFSHDKDNDIFDDGILKYKKARQNALYGKWGGVYGKAAA